MASPIKSTPILTGEDAKRFLDSLKNAKYSYAKEKHLKECRGIYEEAKKRWK